MNWSDEEYNEGYLQGYMLGMMITQTRIIISLIRAEQLGMLEATMDTLFSDNAMMFVKEAAEIIKKYPHYNKEHLAKKVIFESTYLPPCMMLHEWNEEE